MRESRNRGRTVILGVAESDAHAVANKLIAGRLRELGFTVLNLGVCTPLTDFAETLAARPEAEAVLIGSLNGHAREDLRDLRELRACGLLHRPVIVGGNLAINAEHRDAAEAELRELGVDLVLDDPGELPAALDGLRAAEVSRV